MCLKNIIFNKIKDPPVILRKENLLVVESEQVVLKNDFCKRKYIF